MFAQILAAIIILALAFHEANGATHIPENTANSQPLIEVYWQGERLTLQASNAPLVQVVTEIGDAVGYETLVFGELDHVLNRSFEAKPLEQALRQILKGVSNAMRYDHAPSPKLTHVILYGNTSLDGQDTLPDPENDAPDAVQASLDSEVADDINLLGERASAGEIDAITTLADLMREDADPVIRGKAAAVLGEIGDSSVVTILQAGLRDDDRRVRIRSIRGLANIKNDQSSQLLAEVMFNHEDMRTRLLAVWALGQQDLPLSQSYLNSALDSGEELIRQAATRALDGNEDNTQPDN